LDYKGELKKLENSGNLRKLDIAPKDENVTNLSTNDYLNLSKHELLKQAAIEAINRYGTGSMGSRLMCGNSELYEELEERLAKLCGYEAALLFGSGFMANIGLLQSVLEKDDFVVFDRLNHASLHEGIINSGAKWRRYRHNDLEDLTRILEKHTPSSGRVFVVVESLFSMDGDMAKVGDIDKIAKRYGAYLIVDEAHAFGVFGKNGVGICSQNSCKPDIFVATLGKAYGGQGGFVACSKSVKDFLLNKSKQFIYSTALPPSSIASSLTAIDIVTQNSLGKTLLDRARVFYEELKSSGFELLPFESQIIPIIIGDSSKCVNFADEVNKNGLYVKAIRPPTVPKGLARVRLSVTLAHSQEDLKKAVSILTCCAKVKNVLK